MYRASFKQIRCRGACCFGNDVIGRISQHQLYALVGSQIQNFGLGRCDQKIDHLHHHGLAFRIFLIVLPGGENADVLQKSAANGAGTLRTARRRTRDKNVDVHARHSKARNSDHFVHTDGECPHARRE